MAVSKQIGKVVPTYAGNYSNTATYEQSTVVIGEDGRTYITTQDGVSGVSPGVTPGFGYFWQILSDRGPAGPGITSITQVATQGFTDVYRIEYGDGQFTNFTVTNGQPGLGVPAGGTTGQVLTKASGTSYDTEWTSLGSAATQNVANNLTTFSPGSVLDARQGLALSDAIATKTAISVYSYTITPSDWMYTSGSTRASYQVANTDISVTDVCIVTPGESAGGDFFGCNVRPGQPKDGFITFVADMPAPTGNVNVRVSVFSSIGVVPR